MAKRAYWESLKKEERQKITAGGTGVGILVMALFGMLIATGAISDVQFSGDTVCAGTEDDPCFAYINFTAETDIFVYPAAYDPWGRNTTVEFEPGVKEWYLERSWGKGWRRYDLTKPCAGTWCGQEKTPGKYSLAWREGKRYQIRIVAYKHNPQDSIKWSAFDGEIDPVFLPVRSGRDVQLFTKQDKGGYVEQYRTVKEYQRNARCVFSRANNSWTPCLENHKNSTVNESYYADSIEWQEILYEGKLLNMTGKDVWCFNQRDGVYCVSHHDGDGREKPDKLKAGVTYIKYPREEAESIKVEGYLKESLDDTRKSAEAIK
jgi:hypothetical protein